MRKSNRRYKKCPKCNRYVLNVKNFYKDENMCFYCFLKTGRIFTRTSMEFMNDEALAYTLAVNNISEWKKIIDKI